MVFPRNICQQKVNCKACTLIVTLMLGLSRITANDNIPRNSGSILSAIARTGNGFHLCSKCKTFFHLQIRKQIFFPSVFLYRMSSGCFWKQRMVSLHGLNNFLYIIVVQGHRNIGNNLYVIFNLYFFAKSSGQNS